MTFQSSYASGFGLSAALIVAIGAQNVFVLRQGLRREHVGAVVLFCALVDILLIAIGVAGAGALLQAVPGLLLLLTAGGALFLGVYGIAALRRAASPGRLVAEDTPGRASLWRTVRQAAAFTLLNPHVYLDTVVLMGSLGQAQAEGARMAFVAGAGSASAVWFSLLGFGARMLAPVFGRPAAWRVLDGLVAGIMLIFAALLLAKVVGMLIG